MVKRYLSLFMSVILVMVLISGCSKVGPGQMEPSDQMQTEPTSASEQTYFVDESVFYFSNEVECSRLFSQRYDGTDLKLVVDSYTYHVEQEGDSVYYLDLDNLCVYHIPTGKTSILIEHAFDYAIEGKHLVYYLDMEEAFQTEVRYRNLETGEDTCLGEIFDGGECDIADGILYFTKYDQECGKGILCACDMETLEIWELAGEQSSYYRLQAVTGGVYFEGYGDNDFAQYFVSADGSTVQKVDAGLTSDCQMFYKSDGEVFCVCSTYDESGSSCSIHRHNSDGSVTDLIWGNDGGYFTVHPLAEGKWLILHTFYGSWIPIDAEEDESYSVYRAEYFLLDKEGNITALDTTGELGHMFAGGDFPVIDSSTARKPVVADIYSMFVANHGYEGAKPICSTTHGAWLNIADRKADIALLAAPTKEEMDYLNDRGVGIEMKLYGGDGLVFIGNAANPVQNLTHEQIIAIYQGEITNWSEVGGPDEPIIVYYRDDQSGSQRLFEKMVFKDLELPKYEELGFWYMDEMSTIVDIVINDPYSIGYSIMTYLDDVYENEQLKVFAVDGVVPSVDTVKDGSYLYHTQGFVVIRSDEPEDSPARRLFNWFGSPVSDEILIANGITPLHGESGIG